MSEDRSATIDRPLAWFGTRSWGGAGLELAFVMFSVVLHFLPETSADPVATVYGYILFFIGILHTQFGLVLLTCSLIAFMDRSVAAAQGKDRRSR